LFGHSKAKKANIFISRNNPGIVKVHDWGEEDGYAMFEHLLEYWKLSKKYNH